ncbi:MAG: glyoxalase/bleomycin resistance/extradiol dioxygenase family protein [Proteobacteria bacterium]|nr:glyoxalase/bleomycin resistance/extradiol dioxygenase family protein [Pseudomonadota bacterium]
MNKSYLPTLTPYLTVKNAKDAITFYENAFGFVWHNKNECKEEPEHVEMSYKDAFIMFAQEGAFGGTTKAPITLGVECSMNLYLYCDDVDAFFKNSLKHGAISLMEPHDAFWGDRVCALKDLNGFMWMFAKKP